MSCGKFLKQLVQSDVIPDKPSHNKVWSNIGMLCLTVVFCKLGWEGTIPEWYGYLYAATVAAPQLISKFITLRWGWKSQQSNNSYSDNEYSEYSDNRYSSSKYSKERVDGRYADTPESEDSKYLRS